MSRIALFIYKSLIHNYNPMAYAPSFVLACYRKKIIPLSLTRLSSFSRFRENLHPPPLDRRWPHHLSDLAAIISLVPLDPNDLESTLCLSIEEQIDFFNKSLIVSFKNPCRSSPHLGSSPPHPQKHILLDLTPRMRDNLHQVITALIQV
ncbi:hypothetical protein L2E82_25360 [Cichorium intybus]|uniref:Uncharacterized protein n=1 Tax=Cichorium intybus TaxID=13427 RepID=A0ACB9E3P6_CICIN|nr:hypothetical protein L2E82_25360 [Cichorium intybus]